MQTSRELTDIYADQGGYAYRKFQFACIQAGNSYLLKQLLSSEIYHTNLVKLFCEDTAASFLALNFVAPQAWDVAVQAGVPEKEADRLYDHFSRGANRSKTVAQMVKVFDRFLIALAEAVKRRSIQKKYSPRVQNTRNYIAEHLGEKLTVDQIAAYLQLTPNYLSHTFKQETGQTITSYILSERIQAAKLLLLQPEATVGDVMDRLGFISQSHFTKAFREDTGMTPGKYQSAMQKGVIPQKIDARSYPDVKQISKTWYIRATEYGQRKGLQQEVDFIKAIRNGDVPWLYAYYHSTEYTEDMQSLFRQDLTCAKETFLYLWPMAVNAAMEGGLKASTSVDIRRRYMPRLYCCETIPEIVELNKEFIMQLVQYVAKNR